MDFATGTAGMAPSLEEVLRFLDFHGEPGGIASSPTSALTPGLDSTLHSPTFFAGLDGQPKVAQGLGATELASQLRQLALLTQAQSQLSPMKQLGGGVEQFAAQLQCQTAANLGQRGLEAGELLALQAALQAAPTRRGGNSKSRTGPINNPLYKVSGCTGQMVQERTMRVAARV